MKCRDLVSALLLMAITAPAVFAVLPPSTSFGETLSNMTAGDWFFYGSVTIALSGLLVMAGALITRFVTRLFRH